MKPTRSAKRTETRRRSATGVSAAAAGGVAVVPAGRPGAWAGVPHSGQNLALGLNAAPHDEHAASMRVPHSGQNFWPGRTSLWQVGQCTATPRVVGMVERVHRGRAAGVPTRERDRLGITRPCDPFSRLSAARLVCAA